MTDVLKNNLRDEIEMREDDEIREKTLIRYTYYNEDEFKTEIVKSVNDINLKDGYINWVYISGLDDEEKIMEIEKKFDIHPLVIEDMLADNERTKVESYGNYLFMVTDVVNYRKVDKFAELDFSQISFILKKNLIITVEEKRSHQFNKMLQRLKYIPASRFKSSDAMFFTLIDQVVDNYYEVIEIIGSDVDKLEEYIMEEPSEDLLEDLYTIKKNLIYLRKTLWPLRNVINEISKMRFYQIDSQTSVYFRDVYDHILQMLEFLEVYRDMTSSLIDSVDTSIGNRTNDVVQVLTVWSTIFLPLTFMTGVYGMNFKYMPELAQKWAYPLFWIIAFVLVVVMILFFKKRKWI
ncbi:MAG: magnesium/cobalt transporter CorA [Peptoniphilaceae bacterium]|nr:magnesium/cobalt transporter CorA [Peptoniphilaceae bacterium]MDY3737510.1 magnesium/cobalt transporter CorA [Peptoniphilaceae bacterium]